MASRPKKPPKPVTVETKLLRVVTKALDAALEEGTARRRNDPQRVLNLRVSSFPFCGLRWFLGLPQSLAADATLDFASLYFTSVGTTVHSVLQEAIASISSETKERIGFRVLNDWVCRDCKCRHGMTTKPDSCKNCQGGSLRREEIELKDDWKVGHIDEVLEVTLGTEVFWVVLDYKTCTTLATEIKGKLPYVGNVMQVKGYVQELRNRGKPAKMAMLVYVPRDNPFRFKIIPVEVNQEQRWLDFYEAQFRLASSVSGPKKLQRLIEERPCANSVPDRYCECPIIDKCAGSDGYQLISVLAEQTRLRMRDRLPVRPP